MDTFTRAYIKAALFASTDESTPSGGEPLDRNYGPEDIDPETVAEMERDCERFQSENAEDIGTRLDQAGHDFWLTRNRHGCGFWETPDWPEDAGKRLTEAAHAFGEYHLYVEDDGIIYGARG